MFGALLYLLSPHETASAIFHICLALHQVISPTPETSCFSEAGY